jgi:hypothetical protein
MGYQAVGGSEQAIACAEAEQPALIFMNMGYRIVTESTRAQSLNRIEKPLTFLSSRLWHGCPNYGGKKLRDWASKRISSPQTLEQTIEEFTANRLPEEML